MRFAYAQSSEWIDEMNGGNHGDIPARNGARHSDFSVRYGPKRNGLEAPLEKSGPAARTD
jgi:hypothetical protein